MSKILYFVLSPLNAAIILLTAAMWCVHEKRHIWARKLGLASWIVLMVFGVLPTGQYLTAKLEGQYPYPVELPRKVAGIIMIGGFIDTELGLQYGTPQVDAAADRLNTFVDMAQKYPYAPLVFASGQGTLDQKGIPEAQMLEPLLERMRAYTRMRLTIEDKSRTTYENAVNAYNLVKPQPDDVWLLVTSAWHMPRAMGAFRAAGWGNVIAVPSDYRTDGTTHLNPGYHGFIGNMALSQMAIKEIGGRILYTVMGQWKPASKTPDAALHN